MALNNRAFGRTSTRFNRLLVKLRKTQADTANFGDYTGSPMMAIQLPPGQTADTLQILDSSGNLLYGMTSQTKTIVDGSATPLADIAVPASAMVGGVIHYLVRATDGTDFQALAGMVTYSCVNKAATITGTITELSTTQAKTVSSGTLTLAWTIVAGTNKMTVKLTPTGSLTETAPYDVTYTIHPIFGDATLV